MKKNNAIATLEGGIIFLSVFYVIYSFSFGLQNNVEELPLVYKLLGIAEYINDDFVEQHTSHFTQATPYITIISSVARILQLNNLTFLFLILHAASILLLYLSLRQIHKNTSKANEFVVLLSTILFISLIKITTDSSNSNPFIPTSRWLFINYLDPELVTYPFLFFTIAAYVSKKYRLSYFYLFLATILHPLYTLYIPYHYY